MVAGLGAQVSLERVIVSLLYTTKGTVAEAERPKMFHALTVTVWRPGARSCKV